MRKVILDCDTGHDDAAAITLALASESLDLLGVTTVMGNLPLWQTYRNTRDLIAHYEVDVPVLKGNAAPLVREVWVGSEDDRGSFFADEELKYGPEIQEDAVTWLKETLERSEEPVTLVPLAPMTNIAKLMLFYPDLVDEKVDSIVCMGGGFKYGNSTGTAELNIYADPEAAQVVFSFGKPVVMCGLDVCHNAFITQTEAKERYSQLNSKTGKFFSRICDDCFAFDQREDLDERFKLWKRPGAIIYDTVPIVYLLHPEIFTTIGADISVECASETCDGMTVCSTDPWHPEKKHVHTLVLDLDRIKYLDVIEEILCNSKL